MSNIKKVISCDQNIIIIDTENKIWIMGNNNDRITGFGKSHEALYSPYRTQIMLETDEDIEKFYVYGRLLSFYTTKKKLYLSRSEYSDEDCTVNDSCSCSCSDRESNSSADYSSVSESDNEFESSESDHSEIEIEIIRPERNTSRRSRSTRSGPRRSRSRQPTPIQSDFLDDNDQMFESLNPNPLENEISIEQLGEIYSSVTYNNEEFKADSDDFKADSDESKADSDDFKADSDDFKADSDESKADSDDFKADSDDFKADSDGSKSDIKSSDEKEDIDNQVNNCDQSSLTNSLDNAIATSTSQSTFLNNEQIKEKIKNFCVETIKKYENEGYEIENIEFEYHFNDFDDFDDNNDNDAVSDNYHIDFDDNDDMVSNDINNRDSDFDNEQFYHQLENENIIFEKKKCGIDLFETDVDDVLFVSESIFFKKNGKLYVYEKSARIRELIYNNLGISVVRLRNYYELNLPFECDKIIFKDNFIYLLNGSTHHIISSYLKNTTKQSNTIFSWIYFKCDLKINEDNIYFNPREGTIYVKYNNRIYKYCHKIKNIKQFVNDNSKTFFITYPDLIKVLVCIKNNGIYLDEGHLSKFLEHYEPLSYMIDLRKLGNGNIIVIDIKDSPRHQTYDNTLFFNVHGLTYYNLTICGIVFCDENDDLFYCTEDILPESNYGTMEIEKISITDGNFYIYKFNHFPKPVTNIQFTDYMIIVQSENKYFYHVIESDNLEISRFTEINCDMENNNNILCRHYIVRNKQSYDNHVTLRVNTEANKLKKLISIIEFLPRSTNFSIDFVKGSGVISYGDGPKRDFMEAAIMEFSDKYLIKHNNCCEFNINEIKKLTDDKLFTIGKMLHAIIYHSDNYLPIRLPITLMAAILKKDPTIADFEYYIKLEDPETFEKMYSYRKDNELIKTFGYESYGECVDFFSKSLCKYYHDEDTNSIIKNTCLQIATGFIKYKNIKNLNMMNIPTLDYYLSGDYKIDVDLLLSLIKFITTKKTDEFSTVVKDIIRSMDQPKLTIFLKNWSGTSIVKRSKTYEINIEKNVNHDVFFRTCSFELFINEKLFSSTARKNILFELLTTPVNFMIDLPYLSDSDSEDSDSESE
jgi:hypothetical protein